MLTDARITAPRPQNKRPTKRELQIIELILEGHQNESIGSQLGITEATVKRHVYNLFRKERVNSRLDFAVLILKRRHAEEIARIVASRPATANS